MDSGFVPLVELPIRLPQPYADFRDFMAPSVAMLNETTMTVSLTHPRNDGRGTSDWNEMNNYKTGQTIVYIVDLRNQTTTDEGDTGGNGGDQGEGIDIVALVMQIIEIIIVIIKSFFANGE